MLFHTNMALVMQMKIQIGLTMRMMLLISLVALDQHGSALLVISGAHALQKSYAS